MSATTVDVGGGFSVSVTETTRYFASTKRSGGGYKRVLRMGGPRGASVPSGAMDFLWWLAPPGTETSQLKVFAFRPSAGLRRSYPRQPQVGYIVATSEGAARSALQKKYQKLVKQYVGMAKDALTTAMKSVSAQSRSNAATGGMVSRSAKAARKVRDLTRAAVFFGGTGARVKVDDDLRYAQEALKSGATVDYALKRAANSVNGAVNAYINSHGGSFFQRGAEFDLQHAPFPEVVG